MPEGHTIHRLARDQTSILVGKTLNISSPQGRFATGAHMLDGLWKDAVKLLHLGVKHNRIITVDLDKIHKPAGRLRYGERTLIFGKTKCPVCASDITRFEISKRRAFRCDSCQPKCET